MGFSGAEKVNLLLSLEDRSVWVHMCKSQATVTGSADLREPSTAVAEYSFSGSQEMSMNFR